MERNQDDSYVKSVKAIKQGEIDPKKWNSDELITFLKQNSIEKSLNAFENIQGKEFIEAKSSLDFKIDMSEKNKINKIIIDLNIYFKEHVLKTLKIGKKRSKEKQLEKEKKNGRDSD